MYQVDYLFLARSPHFPQISDLPTLVSMGGEVELEGHKEGEEEEEEEDGVEEVGLGSASWACCTAGRPC